jgi:hypothetical protein
MLLCRPELLVLLPNSLLLAHMYTHNHPQQRKKHPKKEVDWTSKRQNPFEVSCTVAVMRNAERLVACVPASCADVAYKIVHAMRSAARDSSPGARRPHIELILCSKLLLQNWPSQLECNGECNGPNHHSMAFLEIFSFTCTDLP